METRILALKGRAARLVDDVRRVVDDFFEDSELAERKSYFEVIRVPDCGYTLLRLSRLDAVLVARNDFGKDSPELAEVVAWLHAQLRLRKNAPIAVNPSRPNVVECEICDHSASQNSNQDSLGNCVQRIFSLVNKSGGRIRPDIELASIPTEALVDPLVRAIEAGWSTPDLKIGKGIERDQSLRRGVKEWVFKFPTLARASFADALAWTANYAPIDGPGGPPLAVPENDVEQIVSCAMAWAFEDTEFGKERHVALASGPARRVAIFWCGGDMLSFRQGLRALMLDNNVPEETSLPRDAESDHGFADLAIRPKRPSLQALPPPSIVQPSSMHKAIRTDLDDSIAPLACLDLAEVKEALATQRFMVPIAVPDHLLDNATAEARSRHYEPIVLRQAALKDLLKHTEQKARDFTDRAITVPQRT